MGRAIMGEYGVGEAGRFPVAEGIEIRQAAHRDMEGTAMTIADSARHRHALDPDLYQVPDLEHLIREVRADSATPNRTTLVGRDGGKIVASADVRIIQPVRRAGMVRPWVTAEVGAAVPRSH